MRAVPGGAANVQDIYPLAPLQEGILFHHLLNGRAAIRICVRSCCRFDVRERLEELIAALQAVIDRHDILRTAVLWEAAAASRCRWCIARRRCRWRRLTLDPDRDAAEQLRSG